MAASEDILVPIVTMIVSFSATVMAVGLIILFYWCCCGDGSIRLGDGLPGAFDDMENFRGEEEAALEIMDGQSRESYLAARRWIEHNPPNSANTDISLSQYMMIQEKAVAAWEFPFDLARMDVVVRNRTEIQFTGPVCCTQTNLPLPKQNEVYYWEVKIYEKHPDAVVSAGLATKPYPLFRLPGMHRYSVAYDSTGAMRLNQPFSAIKYGRPINQGDVVGVGYRPRTGTVFFTHNGKRFDEVVQGMRVNLFPTVGANGPCFVVVNFGQAGFVYIEANVKKWGLAPAHGTLVPPPAYGNQENSVLLAPASHSPPRLPPAFDAAVSDAEEMEGTIRMAPLPPPYAADKDAIDDRPEDQHEIASEQARQEATVDEHAEARSAGPASEIQEPAGEDAVTDGLQRHSSPLGEQEPNAHTLHSHSASSSGSPASSGASSGNAPAGRVPLADALAEAQEDGPWQSG